MTPPRKLSHYVRPSEAARTLGVTRHTIVARIARKMYRSLTIGGVTYVRREDIERAASATAGNDAAA